LGILVIQIKPQLERVLNLPEDCLTKEIKLTQELLQLFVEYHIPSDLLSHDPEASAERKPVDAVKTHVAAMQELVRQAKEEEEAYRQRDEVKSLEHYCLELKSALQEEKLKDRWEVRDKMKLRNKVQETLDWLRKNVFAETYAFEGKQKELEAIAIPIMTKIYQEAGKGGMPGGIPGGDFGGGAWGDDCDVGLDCGGGDWGFGMDPQPPPQQPTQQPSCLASGIRDYTQLPKEMDRRIDEFDTDSLLRPAIITPGGSWTKTTQRALLASPSTTTLRGDEQKKERDFAFDLLDVLTKSGSLLVEHASLHIVVAVAHCFDKSVIETVIQNNCNPIEKVERSMLIMASTVHQLPAAALIQEAELPRLRSSSPALLSAEASG